MSTAAFLTTAKRWRQPLCPATRERMNTSGDTHMMEYYSALKREKAPTRAVTGKNHEDVLRGKRSQTQKATRCTIPFVRTVQNRPVCRDG